MSITAAACPSCVFGATSTSLLSLAYHTIETINVTVNTYITVYPDGDRSTSYQSVTQNVTELVGSASGVGNNASRTYTNLNDITWTLGDATLTYPTTYVQYLGFEGAPATSNAGQTCADPAKAASVTLPASTEYAPFIYPFTTGATLLPAPLLEYLGQLAPVSAQFDGMPLTGCAPLDFVPATTSSTPSSSSSLSQSPISSASAYSESQVAGSLSSAAAHGNYTRPAPKTNHNHRPTRLTPGAPVPSSSVAFGSAIPPASSGIAGSEVPPYTATTAVTVPHTTVFVIQTLTGRTIVTTKKGGPDIPHHTQGSDHQTGGGDTSHHTTKRPHEQPGGYSTSGDSTPTGAGHHSHNIQPGNVDHHPSNNNSPGHNQSPGNNNQSPGGHRQNGGGGNHHVATAGHDTNTGHTHQVFNVGHTHITAKTNGVVALGSHTVHRGQTVTIGSGSSATTVALQNKGGHDRLVVNGKTYKAHQAVAATTGSGTNHQISQAIITTNGHTITAIHSGKSLILEDGSSKTTVAAGSKVNFEGQTIGVTTSGGSVAVNGHHVPLTTTAQSQAVITAGGHTITALRTGNSVILKDGSSTITLKNGYLTKFEGQRISIGSSGSAIAVNGKTVSMSAAEATGEATITAGGHTITAVNAGNSVILKDGSSTITLKDGYLTKFEGQRISIGADGSAVVVNGKTVSMSAVSTPEAVIMAGGHTFTALDKSGSVVLEDGSSTATVQDGHVITFEGQTVSAKPSGTAVVVNGKTIKLNSEGSATTTGIGGYVANGLGGGNKATGTTAPSTGAAAQAGLRGIQMLGAVISGLLAILVVL